MASQSSPQHTLERRSMRKKPTITTCTSAPTLDCFFFASRHKLESPLTLLIIVNFTQAKIWERANTYGSDNNNNLIRSTANDLENTEKKEPFTNNTIDAHLSLLALNSVTNRNKGIVSARTTTNTHYESIITSTRLTCHERISMEY
jgi:hypothetical protein